MQNKLTAHSVSQKNGSMIETVLNSGRVPHHSQPTKAPAIVLVHTMQRES